MRCWSPCSLLVVIVIYCLSSHTSEAFDLAQACVESQRLSLLPICDTIFAVQQEGAQQSKYLSFFNESVMPCLLLLHDQKLTLQNKNYFKEDI